jgi:hypothetical protein
VAGSTIGRTFLKTDYCDVIDMTDAQIKHQLNLIIQDVQALPVAAVPLVGALVAIQTGLPAWLNKFIMDQLNARADLSVVSPAAEAMMRLSAFAAYRDMAFAQLEIQRQFELLKAIGLDDKILVAAAFMAGLADRLLAAAGKSAE